MLTGSKGALFDTRLMNSSSSRVVLFPTVEGELPVQINSRACSLLQQWNFHVETLTKRSDLKAPLLSDS